MLKGHYCKTFIKNTYSQIEIKAFFHFSHYKSMETLSYHSNENTWATTIKKKKKQKRKKKKKQNKKTTTTTKNSNNNKKKKKMYRLISINIYAKFQLHPPYGFWEEDFWMFFFFFLRKFSLSVAMTTNQRQRDLDKIHMVGRGLLQKQFSKTFVKISAITQK